MSCPCRCHDCYKLTMAPEFPSATPLPNKSEEWRTDCHWLSPLINGKAVLIRRGFYTDWASIPRFAWRVIGHPTSKYLIGHALPHDALYAAELMPRDDCDEWFLTSMAKAAENYPLEVGWAKRNAIWSAVRVGGSFVWGKHKAAGIEAARKLVTLLDVEEWDAYRRLGCLVEVVDPSTLM